MRPRVQIPGTQGQVDPPVTFVTSETQGNMHIFVSDTIEMRIVEIIANNFSRRVQQPVKVFHDEWREKYRLCPLPSSAQANTATYGDFCFECDSSEPKIPEVPSNDSGGDSGHIPRPRNSWILYRQHKAALLKDEYPGITASELSTLISSMWKGLPEEEKAIWQQKAQEEDRLHKEKYSGYKYSTKKSPAKGR